VSGGEQPMHRSYRVLRPPFWPVRVLLAAA
jgi:hypothetical protein